MDKVPVKISEKYKPPPRLYQLPQAVLNKLSIPVDFYDEPQYNYDFQLERKVLAKIPDWKRMRQIQREARCERNQKREEQRLRDLEVQQKQLLGAVSYPSAEDLSSTESEDESLNVNKVERPTQKITDKEKITLMSSQTCSFHNILQPTILSSNDNDVLAHAGNVLNAFNYKDFEEDTSSPFDNIELKTINDLDILAQVLHDTQLKVNKQQKEIEEQQSKESALAKETPIEQNSNHITNEESISVETAKTVLSRVDFEASKQNENENIPMSLDNTISSQSVVHAQQNLSNAHNTFTSSFTPYNSQTAIATYTTPYNQLYNGFEQQLQQQTQQNQYSNYHESSAHSNQNLLFSANIKGSRTIPNAYLSPAHAANRNAPSYNNGVKTHYYSPPHPTLLSVQVQTELNSKSKSVPDIIKELSDEVRNSKMRRTRNHSQNLDDNQTEVSLVHDEMAPTHQMVVKSGALNKQQTQCFGKLEASAQALAKNISRMGFPLDRVAKIAQMFGTDDKKIIEHLIPLSELMDLGFEETKISEALVKFNNNKEKALEYLIS